MSRPDLPRIPSPLAGCGLAHPRLRFVFLLIALVVPTVASAQVSPPPPVAHWPLDESAGLVATDVGPEGLDGALVGEATWSELGQSEGGLALEGAGYVEVAPAAALDLSSALTLAAWVRPDRVDSHQALISKDDSYELEIALTDPGELSLRLGNIKVGAGNTPLQVDRWQHLAVVWDSVSVTYYRNGLPDGNTPFEGILPASAASLGLGARPTELAFGGSVFLFEGTLDDVRLHDRALSPEEIGQIFATTFDDIDPPRPTAGIPGTVLPAGTTETTLELRTDELALCRWSSEGGTPFSAMDASFSTLPAIRHAALVAGLEDETLSHFFVRCRDDKGNANAEDFPIVVAVSSAADLEAGLLAHWALDDVEDCIAEDNSGHGRDGEVLPDCPAGGPTSAPGQFGQGAVFADAADTIRVAADPELDSLQTLTLAAWLRHPFTHRFTAIVDKRDAGNRGFDLFLDPSSKLFLRVDDATLVGQQVVADDRWHHVAGVFDGSELRLYVDGAFEGSTAAAGLTTTSADLLLGHHFAISDFTLQGILDDVRLYDRALSEIELAALAFFFDPEPPGLTVTYPADGQIVEEAELLVTGTAQDNRGVVDVTIEGQPADLIGDAFEALVHLVEGTNTLTIEAEDTAGNRTSTTLEVTLRTDTTPPDLFFETPVSGLFLGSNQPELSLSFMDDDSGVDTASLAFSANGSTLDADCTFDALSAQCLPATPLPEGMVELGATIRDMAGNLASTSVQLTVDTAGVAIEIDQPAPGLVTADDTVWVTGSISSGVTSVIVDETVAVISGGTFSATVPLREGSQMVVAVATKSNGNTGASAVDVTRDIAPPIVKITSPRDGLVAIDSPITITGRVNDVVDGGQAAHVLVNGLEAVVSNGSFVLADLPLEPGTNTVEAVAIDSVGNQGEDAITVGLHPSGVGYRLRQAAGNAQRGVVRTWSSEPLAVAVEDAAGQPVAGRMVRFEVIRNNGILRTGNTEGRVLQVATNGAGLAEVDWRLGDTAGEGNNRVRVTSLGVAGELELCASAIAAAPDKILMEDGDHQRGLVGHPAPIPLEAVVVDTEGNPIEGLSVTFEVVKGHGTLDGQPSLVRTTDSRGRSRAVLTLGMDPGINNNVVQASFEGLAGLPATFTASGLAPGDPSQTQMAGVVLDNGQTPIPGAAVSIGGTELSAVTDEEGQFVIDGAPVGHIHLHIDPTDSPRPETFPPLAFETVTVAGHRNTLGQPILIPAIDSENALWVGGEQDVTLTMEGVEGLELTVFAGSTTFPDGSSTGQLSISQVHLDKVPMAPPNGGLFLPPAWTLQPAGVVFDPPARIRLPNNGLPPGRVVGIFQFDHEINDFLEVARGTVDDGGLTIVSDPGVGITRSGWGGGGPPPPPATNPCKCSPCQECVNGRCVPDEARLMACRTPEAQGMYGTPCAFKGGIGGKNRGGCWSWLIDEDGNPHTARKRFCYVDYGQHGVPPHMGDPNLCCPNAPPGPARIDWTGPAGNYQCTLVEYCPTPGVCADLGPL